MIVRTTDFNAAGNAIARLYSRQWEDVARALESMPLHLKVSDQRGIQGTPIFDPVGTNEYIKKALTEADLRWRANLPIPNEYDFLGTDVDFCNEGMLLEVQFSHYSFLLNNLLRSELFFKSKTLLAGYASGVVVIVTKAHMFPASNSTLYYEQAVNQLASLATNRVFDVPIRIVGLFEQTGVPVPIKMTEYGSHIRVENQLSGISNAQDNSCNKVFWKLARMNCLLFVVMFYVPEEPNISRVFSVRVT